METVPRETYDGYGEISDVCIKRKDQKPTAGYGRKYICAE